MARVKRPPRVSIGQIEAALRKNAGLQSLTARDLKLTPAALCNRIKATPYLQEVLRQIEYDTGDLVEGTILEAIRGNRAKGIKPDPATARWYADRKLKSRGYGQKLEVTASDADLEAIVGAFGGDLERLRALRAAIALPAQSEEPEPSA